MLQQIIEALLGPKNWDSSDRRSQLRTKIDLALDLSFPSFRCYGTSIDVGPSGLRCRIPATDEAAEHLTKGQVVQVRYEPDRFKGRHTVECKTRWVRKEGDRYILMGLAFADTPENLRRSWLPLVIAEGLQADRKLLRAPTAIEADIKDGASGPTAALVRDLSAGGALVDSAQAVEEGSNVSLTLKFSPPHASTTFQAIVCRCQAIPGGFQLGVTFMLSSKQRKFLQDLVKALVEVQNPSLPQ